MDRTPLNQLPYPATGKLVPIREGTTDSATIIAVGPMLDPVLGAIHHLDLTVVYASTVRPFDGAGLRRAVRGSDLILVEPYLEGTSAGEIADAVRNLPHRLLSIGVPNSELRRYGTRHQHAEAHRLDIAGLQSRIESFLRNR